MIARLLARFRRTPQPTPTHPSVGLIRTERNIDPITFGTDAALRVLLEDEARAQRRADAEDVLRRAGFDGDAA